MSVSGQGQQLGAPVEKGPRARMRRHMLDTALRLMQGGVTPSVSDVAEAAEVSRATAYRYFPSQAAMIQAVVDEALGPILGWTSEGGDGGARVRELIEFAYPRMQHFEATHRAALLLALNQWARRQAGTLDREPPIVRGNRKALLCNALAPLQDEMSHAEFDKLAQALSLIFGIEAIIVLRDIWGLDGEQAEAVALWAADALVRTAKAEASGTHPTGDRKRPRQSKVQNAAARPRHMQN